MSQVRNIIAQVIGGLPPEAAALVRERVSFEVRRRPNATDLERGAEPGDRGYFYGLRVRGDDEDDDGEVFTADEGDDVAELEPYEPGGVVVLFVDNLATPADVAETVTHELAHFMGEGEDEAAELGLGDVEEGTIVEVEAIE